MIEKPRFRYRNNGTLMCSEHVDGLTQTLKREDEIKYYGGKFFICETITQKAAEMIAGTFGWPLDIESEEVENGEQKSETRLLSCAAPAGLRV